MKTVWISLALSALIAAGGAPQDAGSVSFELKARKGVSLTIEGTASGLPDEAIVDVVLERVMNRANYINPVLEKVRADMPLRQNAEVAKGKFKAVFPCQPVGPYVVRAELLIKFQRSNKVGKAMTKGDLKEFSSEKLVFLGTTDELIESIRASIEPIDRIALKMVEVLDAAMDPKTDPGTLSAHCDKLSDEIDRVKEASALPGTLHALKGHAENLARQFRGMAPKKAGDAGTGKQGSGGLQRPDPGAGNGPGQQGNAPKDGEPANPGNENPFLVPGEAPKRAEAAGGIKIGDRFGPAAPAGGKPGEAPANPIARSKQQLEQIVKLYSREIAIVLLDRAKDLLAGVRAGDVKADVAAQIEKLAQAHGGRASAADKAGQVYLEVTTVANLPLAKFWEKAVLYVGDKRPPAGTELDALAKQVDEMWEQFNAEIRNRTR